MDRSSISFLVPFYFFLLGLLVLFSLILLFQGITGIDKNDGAMSTIFVMTGAIGLVSTFYMIRRYQVGIQKLLKERRIAVLTVEECLKCNYRAVRPFREGDFIYGHGDECPRCPKGINDVEAAKNRMLITAIYLDKGEEEPSSRIRKLS